MSLISKIKRDSWVWRNKFGHIQGLIIYLKLYKLLNANHNELVKVSLPFLRFPFSFRAGTSDIKVLFQIALGGELNFSLANPRVIIDAGANIGLVSCMLATRYPSATIYALEVDSKNYELLENNAQLYTNIKPLKTGLWSHRTMLTIENPHDESWAFKVREAYDSDNDLIPAVGIDDLLMEFNISLVDLLKIDIEGGEVEVFMSEGKKWLDKTNTIAIELHDRIRENCSSAFFNSINGDQFSIDYFGEYVVARRKVLTN